MQKVLPLKKWESHKLPEREHFSDQDSEDESEEYISDEEIVIPKRKQKNKPKPKLKRKRKSKPKPKSAKKKKLRIPKKQSAVSREPVPVSGSKRSRVDPPGPPRGPLPKRIRGNEKKPSQIPSRK